MLGIILADGLRMLSFNSSGVELPECWKDEGPLSGPENFDGILVPSGAKDKCWPRNLGKIACDRPVLFHWNIQTLALRILIHFYYRCFVRTCILYINNSRMEGKGWRYPERPGHSFAWSRKWFILPSEPPPPQKSCAVAKTWVCKSTAFVVLLDTCPEILWDLFLEK